jgi:hypothetical protein
MEPGRVVGEHEVLDVDVLLDAVDRLHDVLDRAVIVGQKFDGVAGEGRHAASINKHPYYSKYFMHPKLTSNRSSKKCVAKSGGSSVKKLTFPTDKCL